MSFCSRNLKTEINANTPQCNAEYDSGTVYDETVEEEEGLEEEIPEYYDEGAAEEDAYRTAEEAHTVITGDDVVHGTAEVVADGTGALSDVEGPPEETIIDYPEEEEEQNEPDAGLEVQEAVADGNEETDTTGVLQDVHPPSDEYYEDPEFSQHHVEQEEEPYEEQYDYDPEETEAEGDPETVQDYTELDRENGKAQEPEETETGLTIDPDASLDEVAEQIEEFEEAAFEREDDVAAEAQAARRKWPLDSIYKAALESRLPFSSDDGPVTSSTSVNVEAVDEDTERIYAGMDSLAAEEQGAVNAHAEPTTAVTPTLPVAKTNGASKRSREDEDENIQSSVPNGIGADGAQTGENL